MPETQRGPGKSTAWGVVAGISGSGTFATWVAATTSGGAFPAWPAWAFGCLTAGATWLCFKPAYGKWSSRGGKIGTEQSALPASRHPDNVALVPERDGVHLRLLLHNNCEPAEFSAQVIAIRDPLGRIIGRQHWTIPWLDDSSTEPKRVLCGETRILDFARYEPTAVHSEIQSGHGDAPHWFFPTVPVPVAARYYNLRSRADLYEQRFLVTVRLMSAGSGSFTDQKLAVGVRGHDPVCEAVVTGRVT